MSVSDVEQPRLSRTAPCASSGPYPIARSTCEGCTFPEEQADPDDTPIPARSNPITAVSAFKPGTVKRTVLGNRDTSSENTIAPGVSRRPVSRRPHKTSTRTVSCSMAPSAAVTAAPNPTMAATFSVPARRPCYCPPPRSKGSNPKTSSASTRAPAPLGPPSLWAESVRRSAPVDVKSNGILQNA